ncbi:sigma-54-dependent Fis family transcriptional regulator [Bacillus sp. Marseille-Q1617]|uniref:sigma-54 interaction domain-containing protein n=1 Tax=Bacillus sp. Marseille-Q1617 TaxID=2736887 RepID=UPI001C37B99F|nr:sigma 54-interacting transcriptional regulator [Bacillus sp. Marseille-Q1617]
MRIRVSEDLERAVELFSSTEEGFLEVQDDKGKSIGVLTLDDMKEIFQKVQLDRTVGEIFHELSGTRQSSNISSTIKNEYSELLENEIFTDIMNSLYDGVFITDGSGITVKINKAYERITDLKPQQLIGYHMEEIIKEGYISKSASIQVIKEKKPVTLMQTIHNGRKIIVSGTPIFNKKKEILYVINSVRDITELLKLKLRIEELQELKNLRQSTKATFMNDSSQSSFHHSETMKKTFEIIDRVAKTDAKVLLQGETGVGKTLVAKYIHEHSNRTVGSFLELNCSALPSSLIEAELFGYEPGAFTGALAKGKKGLLEIADNGTLFLDEIGDLPLELQVKLLKVIEDQAFIPIGASKLKQINVRIIAASHKNIKELVKNGEFREDLYYRLNVVPIEIPSLRDRQEEIIPLAEQFLEEFNIEYGFSKRLSIEALNILHEYKWPGNIRELKNCIERLVVTSPTDTIASGDLPYELGEISNKQEGFPTDTEIIPLKEAVDSVERNLITRALKKYKTTRKAAEVLQVSQSTIVQKMKKWEI